MKTLAVSPVRLNLYRSDIALPTDPRPPYYLFGEYDYLSIEQPTNFDAEPKAEAVVLATLYPGENSSNSSKILDWCAGSISQGLLVRLDLGITGSAFQKRNWVSALCGCADQVYARLPDSSLCLLSVGSFSVYVLIDLCTSDLITEMGKLAELKLEQDTLIARTTTMPFVSSSLAGAEEVSGPLPSKSLVRAQINISCPFFRQAEVLEYVHSNFDKNLVSIVETLGDYDIGVYYKDRVPLLSVAQCTHKLRKNFSNTRTFTNIGADIASHAYSLTVPENPKRFDIGRHARSRPARLLDKLAWISKRLNASQQDKIGELAQADLFPVIENIVKNLDLGKRFLDDTLGNDLIDAVIEAYIQRGGHRSLPSKDHELALTNLALGAFLPFKAMHSFASATYTHIVSLIDEAFIKQNGISSSWDGLIVASNSHGFEIYPLSIVQVPYDALLNPCQRDLTWQTLSHEICHVAASWYLESSKMKAQLQNLVDELTKKKLTKVPYEVYLTAIREDFSEVAAHYLDYLFFYGGSIEDYFRAIWSTWPAFISLTSNEAASNGTSFYRHYVMRSFAIFFIHNKLIEQLGHLDFSDPKKWIPTAQQTLEEPLREFAILMEACLDDEQRSSTIRYLIEADSGKAISGQVARLAPLIDGLVKEVGKSLKSGAMEVIKASRTDVDKLESLRHSIRSGIAVLEGAEVSHLLIRDYHLEQIKKHTGSSPGISDQLALVLTFAGERNVLP